MKIKITGILCEQVFGVVEMKALLEWVHKRMGRYELEIVNRDNTSKKFCCVQKQKFEAVVKR